MSYCSIRLLGMGSIVSLRCHAIKKFHLLFFKDYCEFFCFVDYTAKKLLVKRDVLRLLSAIMTLIQ